MRSVAVCHSELVIRLLEAVLTPNSELDVMVESRALARRVEHSNLSMTVDDPGRVDSYVKIDISPTVPIIVEDNGRRGMR